VRTDPRTLLRGLAKFVAVVLASALAGAAIGIALAKLSGNDTSSDPLVPSATARSSTARTQAAGSSSGSRTATTAGYRVPLVDVRSAQLATTDAGGSHVTAKVRVTNRGARPLTIKVPVLVSQADEIPLDEERQLARKVLAAIPAGETASGVLRFTMSPAITQRLTERPLARLRIANRTVTLKLATPEPASPGAG
jgi:hypothetical protein